MTKIIRVVITDHAKMRMNQRMNIRRNQTLKIAYKAYFSERNIENRFLKKIKKEKDLGFQTYIFRQYAKHLFVFQKRGDDCDYALLTVY